MKILWRNKRGVSLVELVVTLVILSFLAMLILPSAQMTAKRVKELELRRNLRIIRTAIDDFKYNYVKAVDEHKITTSLNKNASGYPETLQQLVDGFDFGGVGKDKKKFLRRIPVDPFNPEKPGDSDEKKKWRLRSYTDEPDSMDWGGEDVYDVSSWSEETAIDGTKYKDW